MKTNSEQSEIERLRIELAETQKHNKCLKDKLERSKSKCAIQKKELKKKEPRIIEVKQEQLKSLSNRLPGIDIQSLLLD